MTAHYRAFFDQSAAKDGIADVPASPYLRLYRDFGKRALDLALVILSLPLWLPMVALLAACVALDGHAPFYRQKRVGRSGRLFTMWKLRTMVPDADLLLSRHLGANPEAAQEWSHKQKLARDPRITGIGRFLRCTSLDEFPQLFNVLRGDMSLVGPRPMLPEQQRLYSGRAYFQLRPGVTGFWQVSDRNASSFADRAAHDTLYYGSLSLPTDIGVLLVTVRAVIKGTGC